MVGFSRLEIGGVVYNNLLTGNVTDSVGDNNNSSSVSLNFKNPNGFLSTTFSVGDEVNVWIDDVVITDTDDAVKIFAGLIENIDKSGVQANNTISLSGRDFSSVLQDITVPPQVFTSTEVTEIIDTLMTALVTDVSYTPVSVGVTIDRISFNHESLFDAIKKLAGLSGCTFTVDVDKALQFKKKGSSSSGISFNNTNVFSSTWKEARSEMVNQVWVYGDNQMIGTSQAFTGDGAGSVFTLNAKPFSLNVSVSGVQQEGGVYGQTTSAESGVNYLLSFDDSKIIFVSGASIGYHVPGSLDAITVSYDKSRPIVKFGRDKTSIDDYKLREKVIQDTNIKDPSSAVDIVKKELLNSLPFVNGTLAVEGVLTINAGMTAIVDLSFDGVTNQTYDILEVTYNIDKNSLLAESFISVNVNKRIRNINDSIKSLFQDVKALQGNSIDTSSGYTRVEFATGSIGIRRQGSGLNPGYTVSTRDIGSEWYLGSPAVKNGFLGSPGSYFIGSSILSFVVVASGGYA